MPVSFRGFAVTLILSCALTAQSNGDRSSLSGTVVNLETGEPIRNALVTVSKSPTPQEVSEYQEAVKAGKPRLPFLSKSVLSGASGEYQFTDLPEGHYVVNAQKPGFAARFNVEGLQPVQVELTGSAGNFIVRLSPLGVIEGTVTDQNGEPVDSVKIEAYTARIEAGVRSITPNHSAICNDRGGFRIWGLEPGQYYLKAAGRNGGTYLFVGQATSRPSSWLSFVPLYAGGGRTFDSATAIAIAAGTQARADFRINLVPSATIRGALENYTLHQGVTFSLRQDGEELADDSRVNLSVTTGRFEITAVPPGDYILTAVGQMARGEMSVRVPESGINGLSMPLWPAVTVTGTVHSVGPAPVASKKATADDNDAEDGPVEPDCRVSLRAPGGQVSPGLPSLPQAKTFSITNVFPGPYRVEFWCTGGYVTSAMFGTNDLLSNPAITIQPGGTPPPIEIAMKPGGGTIHAKLAAKSARQRGAVLAVPGFSSSTGPSFLPLGFADDGQEIELDSLAPGDYLVYAFSTQEVEYRNAAVLQALTGGTSVHVDDGKTSEITLDKVVK
jgi:protocatechuate 3,4-dioxygenase beta subunit